MKSKKIFLAIWVCVISGFLLSSCKDDFTTDGSYRLTYSTDSLNFDTIFTGILTPTEWIKIYNETDKDIRIENCQLHTNRNYFQINLNGQSGTEFHDIEIPAGDSLYLFVQLFVDEIGADAPLYIEDYIIFSYNGNLEKIVLTTYGQDVHLLKKRHITSDTTWTNDKPFLIYDSLIVDSATKLTLQAGTRIYLHNNATILMNGVLICNGDASSPILFTGDRNDGNYATFSKQWGGIRLSETSTGNFFNHTLIKNGTFGICIDSAAIEEDEYRLTFANSQIHNVHQTGLQATCANVYAYNSLFTNGLSGCVNLQGGEYLFNHCTLCSYDKISTLSPFALRISEKKGWKSDDQTTVEAKFNNCIVTGTQVNELLLQYETLTDAYKIHFDHCLLKYNGYAKEMMSEQYFTNIISFA